MIMARFDKTIKPSAAIPCRKSSLGRREKSNSSIHETILLHSTRHLIVTTTKGVFTWGNQGIKKIFTSGSGGIVAARRVKNGGSLLAVADSQVVILHDTRKGMQKSYKLRGSDGQVRLLRYAGDSKSLFFTTTLQNAVQTYSLKESKLLDPSYNHPSPPTVFAISPNFHFLLSASISPPTIHLTNISLNTPPVVIHPQCSSSAVVTAEFHPKSPTVFLMAFADGTCATYDAARLFRDGGRGERRPGPAASGATAETSSIKNVHIVSNRRSVIASGSRTEPDDFDVGVGGARIGSKYIGITAAGFVPGYKRRILTVGSDGNCFVIDHEGPGKKEAYVVNSWNIQGPATSLSITPFQPELGAFGQNGIRRPSNAGSARKGKIIIAIGRQDGYVLLYDLQGTQLSKQNFHAEASRIVDVEWMNGEDRNGLKRGESGNVSPQTIFSGARKNIASMLVKGKSETLPITDCIELPLDIPTRDSSIKDKNKREDTIERTTQGEKNTKREAATIDDLNQHYLAVTALNHLDIFSPVKSLEPSPAVERSQDEPPHESDNSEATVRAKRICSISPSTQDALQKKLANSIPPRPVSKRKHAATAQAEAVSLTREKAVDTKAQPIDRSMAAGPSRRGADLSLFASYLKPNIIAVPSAVSDAEPRTFSNDTLNRNTTLEEDVWTDISPPFLQPTRPLPTRTSLKQNRSQHKFSSETSNNRFIDWTAASARPPNALVPHPPLVSVNKSSKKARKGHISISPSVVSEDLPIQWSSFKEPSIFNIHKDRRKTESFHPLPKYLSHPTPALTIPLAETTHNPKSAKPSPPPLPYSIREDLDQLQSELTQQLRTVMQSEVRNLKDEMMRQFMAQKRWIEVKIEEWRDREKLLEEENRGLRGQLARERRWKIGGMRG